MPRVSQEAFNAALASFSTHQFSTKFASAIEVFLTALRLAALNIGVPRISDANSVVEDLFVVDGSVAIGRLSPFRYDWRDVDGSGRKTVWNQATRGSKTATQTLRGDDIRNGLRPDAIERLVDLLPPWTDGSVGPPTEALAALITRNEDFSEGQSWPDVVERAAENLGVTPADFRRFTVSDPLGLPPLSETDWTVGGIPPELAPPSTAVIAAPASRPRTGVPSPVRQEILIDSRLERMLRRAASRYPCILLIGPPGTGKSTLIDWVAAEVREDPESFGFRADYDPNPLWKTPDESWSSFDLVGGLTPDDEGELRWTNGAVLDAVGADRWLVLDETNRADMDRIMGPLFTWLSGQFVEVGTTRAIGGDPITLGWTPDSDATSSTQAFVASPDWRLWGSYNPQDAQRVFRFGVALSRRFVVIPVAAISPGQFEQLMSSRFGALAPETLEALVSLYEAHVSDPSTMLGPAIFLRMAEYLSDQIEVLDGELLAEAYVMNVGRYITIYDDTTLEGLRARIVDDAGAILPAQWAWVLSQRDTIG